MPPSSPKKTPLRSDKLGAHHKSGDRVQAKELAALMEEVAQAVDYSQFSHLSVDRFSLLLRLARYDQFSDGTNERKARWLGIGEASVKVLRRAKEYRQIVAAVRKAFIQISIPRSFRDHVDDTRNQDKLFRRMRTAAFYSDDERYSSRVLEKLAESTVPRAALGKQAINIYVSDEHAKLIVDTLEEVKEIEGQVIDVQHSEVHAEPDEGDQGEGEV